MKLLSISESGVSRRDFLRKGIAAVVSATINPLKLLLSSGITPAVASGLQAGGALPFLITAVGNHAHRAESPSSMSEIFSDINRVSAISRRLSDTGLIAGYDEVAYIGGEIGLDKLADIIKAANDGTTIRLAGIEYEVHDDEEEIYLTSPHGKLHDHDMDITIYKDPEHAAEIFSIESFIENPIKKIWDDWLKFGGSYVDGAARKIIKDMNLDMSQFPSEERDASQFDKEFEGNDNDGDESEGDVVDSREQPQTISRDGKIYGSAMHQPFECKLNEIFDLIDEQLRKST